MKPPPIRYADSPEGKIAYQTLGDGPLDLVFASLANQHNLDAIWEHPPIERYLRRLASFSRLILINYRGTGLSDPIPLGAPPTLEEWMTDMKWVLDAIGSEHAAFVAAEHGGLWSTFFAATFPDRTRALVLLNSFASLIRHDDYPAGFPPDALDRFAQYALAASGTGEVLQMLAPELASDERFRDWFARLQRLSAGPRMNELLWDTGYSDARGILPQIQAPTLVISHAGHPWIRSGHGRYLAEHIPGARLIERPGHWGLYWAHDVEWTLDEVQAFLTGTRGAADVEDRVLLTVLFSDIVRSTERAAELGDRRWRLLLDEHDTVIRREIERLRGRAVKSTGDGFLATFDGPARAIRCAVALNETVRSLGIELRTGLHTGEVELRGEDVGGIAVHIAARVMNQADPSEVLVSGSIPPLVAGSGIEFEDHGEHALKGVPGEWRLYAVRAS